MKPLLIGNSQAFWGDRPSASFELLSQKPDLDYLTLDYLAEVSMSILALQREKDSNLGYAKDFLDVIKSLIPFWKKNLTFKIITNAGGLNPIACAEACKKILEENGITLKIGVVYGDNILELIKNHPENYRNLDTDRSIEPLVDKLVSANAYLGSYPIIEALEQGANIVITGRVADPCLVASCCMHHFKWKPDSYDLVASGIIAGHLIECGTQVTGGFSTNWLNYPEIHHLGYPIIEMNSDGTFIITKAKESGGIVSIETVKEQLLYEIGDPDNYLSPDATVSFLNLSLSDLGMNRIQISGAKGKKPPDSLKVSATYRDGYKIEGMISIVGRECRKKAILCAQILEMRIKKAGYLLDEIYYECLGTGDIVASMPKSETFETVLRVAARAQTKEPLEALSKEIASLVTHGPQGTTGYLSGRPKVREVFSFIPTLIDSKLVNAEVKIL